jgi:eukaryotic-like serine/threonine-protein kinase
MAFPEIPGYEILEQIGRGGMGVVYKARHLSLDRIVALKVLSATVSDDADFVKCFAQEAKLIAKLSHPNIVSVYDFGNHGDIYYLSMQYAQGQTVRDIMASRKLTLQECASVVLQIADALDYAHRSEVIHRDIKPGNIMVCADGRALLMDFGVAFGTYSTGASAVWLTAGSPAYMSPEQCMGRGAAPRSDQYSLGVTVYEMITGRLPFPDADPVVTMRQHIHDTPTPMRMGRLDITPRLEAAVARALNKRPEMRYMSAMEFAREVDAAVKEEPQQQSYIGQTPAASPSTGYGRGPVSLIDGTPAQAPAHLPQGYVYRTRGGDSAGSGSVVKWIVIVAVVMAAAIALYVALGPRAQVSGGGPSSPQPAQSGSEKPAK